ncbi:CRISPR-associated protein Cas4 [Aquifex pyrophilus]
MNLKELKFKGTQVAYAVICLRKLWLFSRGVSFEHTSDRVLLGKVIDENTFKEEEGITDESVSIAFLKAGDEVIVHEVKLTSSLEEAHILQVKYYIYYLKQKGIKTRKGILHYPRAKRIKEVHLTEEDEKLIENTLEKIEKVLSSATPPRVEKKPYRKSCAYYMFCYG